MFLSDLWHSFKSSYGPVIGWIVIVIGILGFFWPNDFTVTLGVKSIVAVCIFVVFVWWTSVMTLWDMLWKTRTLPAALTTYETFNSDLSSSQLILLMNPSGLISIGMQVGIFYKEPYGKKDNEFFELHIGMGRVINVQESGTIQVLVLLQAKEHSDMWDNLRQKKVLTLQSTVIKPYNNLLWEIERND